MEQRERNLALELRAAYEAGKLAARFDARRAGLCPPAGRRRAAGVSDAQAQKTEDGWHH